MRSSLVGTASAIAIAIVTAWGWSDPDGPSAMADPTEVPGDAGAGEPPASDADVGAPDASLNDGGAIDAAGGATPAAPAPGPPRDLRIELGLFTGAQVILPGSRRSPAAASRSDSAAVTGSGGGWWSTASSGSRRRPPVTRACSCSRGAFTAFWNCRPMGCAVASYDRSSRLDLAGSRRPMRRPPSTARRSSSRSRIRIPTSSSTPAWASSTRGLGALGLRFDARAVDDAAREGPVRHA